MPLSGRSSPAMSRSRVVLPHPEEGPSRQRMSPSARLTSGMKGWWLKVFETRSRLRSFISEPSGGFGRSFSSKTKPAAVTIISRLLMAIAWP